MKELTKAEEQVMQILWEMEKGFVNDMVDKFPEPKPAYNTVSTIIRILEKKGFVDHKAYGKTFEYFPVVSREKYTKAFFSGFLNRYFSSSFKQLVSFFSKGNNMTVAEMEDIMKMLEKEIEKQKNEK
jgi:BlaI family transcriptional regulator, penicillinase repressor